MHIKIAFDDGSGATRLESSEQLAGRHARGKIRLYRAARFHRIGGRIMVHRECRQWQHNVGANRVAPQLLSRSAERFGTSQFWAVNGQPAPYLPSSGSNRPSREPIGALTIFPGSQLPL